jgi:orotate phosphoribosyltransferase
MTPADVARTLLEIGAVEIRCEPAAWFTWASGLRAPIYCDNRRLISYPKERRRIADALAASVRAHFPDAEVIAGTATAGIPHAAWVAERLDLPMVYVRGSAKGHGQGRQVEGRPLRGERVALVEDLLSTGGSACDAVDALQREGGVVTGVQAIVTYGFPEAERALAARSLPYRALVSYDEILSVLALSPTEAQTLREWRTADRQATPRLNLNVSTSQPCRPHSRRDDPGATS